MSLEADPSPVKSADEITALDNALWENLNQRTQLSTVQIPNPQKVGDNKYVPF